MTKPGDIKEEAQKEFDDAVDEFSGSASSIDDLEKIVTSILSTLPRLNRLKLRQEMEQMEVSLRQNPTTKDLNEGLANAQGYKDRLAEIYTMALREFKTRQRCVDLLFDAFNVISKGSSADKRKGEATMKYPMMLIQLEGSETFLKETEHIIQNIKSAMEAISRQVTLMQIQVQLGEVRRGSGGEVTAYDAEEVTAKGGPKEKNWGDF